MPMTPMPVLPQAVVLAVLAVHGNAARLRRSVLSPADPYCRKRPYWSSSSRLVLLQAAVLVARLVGQDRILTEVSARCHIPLTSCLAASSVQPSAASCCASASASSTLSLCSSLAAAATATAGLRAVAAAAADDGDDDDDAPHAAPNATCVGAMYSSYCRCSSCCCRCHHPLASACSADCAPA